MKELAVIQTPRFEMRILTAQDASERYLNWLKTQVSQFIIYKQSNLADLKKYINSQVSNSDVYFYGIFHEKSGHIGNVKFEMKAPHSAEMGILIGEEIWHGKGVAKEVILGFAQHAKRYLALKEITLGVEKSHQAAVFAYQKIGFVVFKETNNGLYMRLAITQ